MRRLKAIFILYLLFSVLVANSQNFISFPDSNARWMNVNCPSGPDNSHCEFVYRTNYCLSGVDTIVGPNTYKKLEICTQGYHGAIRDNGLGQVYFIPKDSSSEYKVYDFDVQLGDTIFDVYTEDLGISDHVVLAADSVLIWGQYHKQLALGPGGMTWIEGIGSTTGLFSYYQYQIEAEFYLECMSHNDTIYFPNEALGNCQLDLGFESIQQTQITISPNPSSIGYITVELAQSQNYGYQIYSSAGQLLQDGFIENQQIPTPTDAGIYILIIQGDGERFYQKMVVQ